MVGERIEPKGSELLAAASRKLRADFNYRRETNPHAGEKGREFEDLVIEFLNNHLPKRFHASRGFVVDSTGSMTGHTDVILYDQLDAFVFRADAENLIIPNDNTAAVLEVKTTLDAAAIENAAQKIEDAKALKKLEIAPAQGSEGDGGLVLTRTRGILFAFDTAITPDTAWKHLAAENDRRNSDLWIDEIVVLDKWHISYGFQPPHLGVQGMYGGKASLGVPVPAIYIVPLVSEKGETTLSEFMVRLTGHLTHFQRRPGLPFSFFVSPGGLRTLGGYWFGTDGGLRPVPATQQIGVTKPPVTVEIAWKNGTLVGRVEWFPWADGHVICFLGFSQGIPGPIRDWFLGPYGEVQVTAYTPTLLVTDVRLGPQPPHFGRALKLFEEPTSPWTLKRL